MMGTEHTEDCNRDDSVQDNQDAGSRPHEQASQITSPGKVPPVTQISPRQRYELLQGPWAYFLQIDLSIEPKLLSQILL